MHSSSCALERPGSERHWHLLHKQGAEEAYSEVNVRGMHDTCRYLLFMTLDRMSLFSHVVRKVERN
jgi:hypothetical protein